ncbi:MAG: hypothetical protein PVG28_19215, partial [Desulfobacterales bacterium]
MAANRTYTITEESIDSITGLWHDSANHLNWDCLFVLPGWLKVWWQAFGNGRTSYLCSIRHRGELIGIAPLMVEGETARLMGDTDVCDFLDVIVVPGREKVFFDILFDHLKEQGIRQLDLEAVRSDSIVGSYLKPALTDQHHAVTCQSVGASMVMELPTSWNVYLRQLTSKQRHEVRRKL